jgi:hypothetical protein
LPDGQVLRSGDLLEHDGTVRQREEVGSQNLDLEGGSWKMGGGIRRSGWFWNRFVCTRNGSGRSCSLGRVVLPSLPSDWERGMERNEQRLGERSRVKRGAGAKRRGLCAQPRL